MRFQPGVIFCPNELQLCRPDELSHPGDIHPWTWSHIATSGWHIITRRDGILHRGGISLGCNMSTWNRNDKYRPSSDCRIKSERVIPSETCVRWFAIHLKDRFQAKFRLSVGPSVGPCIICIISLVTYTFYRNTFKVMFENILSKAEPLEWKSTVSVFMN